jgi:DNA-binding phage protein
MKKSRPKTIPLKEYEKWFDAKYPEHKEEIEASIKESILKMQIQEAMKAIGMKSSQLSEKSGVSRDKLNRLLNGKQNATISTLVRISNALGKELEITLK